MPPLLHIPAERGVNALLGLSVASWAGLGLAAAGGAVHLSAVPWTIAALHLCAGTLLMLRAPSRSSGSVWDVLASLPALVVAGWALGVAAPPAAWPWHAQALFVAGGAWAITAFCVLGRSFAIFPALRGVVVRGPYRLVRHPAYSGELLMIFACALAGPGAYAWLPLAAALPFVALRIQVEERMLRASPQYVDYAQRVPWRLVPFVW